MTERYPPRLADWLLRQFYFVRRNPALTGDLLELFDGGRSAAWYWRQTLVIVLHGLCRNAYLFREYLAALGLGWAVQAAVVLVLWGKHYPEASHGIGALVVAFLLMVLPHILVWEAKTAIFGRTSWTLQLLSRYDWQAMQRRTVLLSLVSAQAFGDGLAAYYFASRVVTLPFSTLIFFEAFALFFDVVLVVARPEASFGKP